MEKQPYSNREIDERLKDIMAGVSRVESQTIKTNGRVTNLERWQSYVIGFCACIVIILLPVALLMVQIYFKLHG